MNFIWRSVNYSTLFQSEKIHLWIASNLMKWTVKILYKHCQRKSCSYITLFSRDLTQITLYLRIHAKHTQPHKTVFLLTVRHNESYISKQKMHGDYWEDFHYAYTVDMLLSLTDIGWTKYSHLRHPNYSGPWEWRFVIDTTRQEGCQYLL